VANLPSTSRQLERYRWQTLHPINSLLLVAPLLLVFHVGVVVLGNHNLLAPTDVYQMLRFFGATAWFLPPLLIVAVLLLQHFTRHHRWRWKLRPEVLGGMVAESMGWMIPLLVMNMVAPRLAMQAQTQPAHELAGRLVANIGAGVYEEFIFRLVLISLLMLIMVDLLSLDKELSAIIAVVLAGVAFSLYHPWENGETFAKFLFRSLAGVFLGTVYMLRGFGIAVGTHTAHNIMITLLAT
jgi:hypothetical protein